MSFESQHTCLKQILSQFNDTDWYIVCNLSHTDPKQTESVGPSLSNTNLLQELDRTILSIQNKVSTTNTKCQYVRYQHTFLLACSSKTNNNVKSYKRKINNAVAVKRKALSSLCHKSILASVIEIRNNLKNTLQNRLQVKIKSLQIYDAKSKNKIPFLGYFICHKSTGYCSNSMSSKTNRKIHLLINTENVIKSLSDMGFCDILGKPKPNFRYYQKSQYDAIAHVSSILRGLACYYELAKSKRACISRCSYIVTHSLALTFAAKYKLSTRSKVFALAGPNLRIDLTSVPRTKQ